MAGWGFMRAVVHRLRSRWGTTQALQAGGGAPAGDVWVPIAVEGPTPLLEMYRDVLRKNGIPAMLRGEGAGRGAMGGAPTMVSLLVPARFDQAARELLDLDGAEVDDRDRGERVERTTDGGER